MYSFHPHDSSELRNWRSIYHPLTIMTVLLVLTLSSLLPLYAGAGEVRHPSPGTRGTGGSISLFDSGLSEREVSLADGGSDNSTSFTLPESCHVLDASMDVAWNNYDHLEVISENCTDRNNVTAWNGTTDNMTAESLSSLQETYFTSKEYNWVKAFDSQSTMSFNMTYETYELYRFNVSVPSYDSITVHWCGLDFMSILKGSTYLVIYNQTSTSWELLAKVVGNPTTSECNLSVDIGAAQHYTGSSSQIWVGVYSPLFGGFSSVITNFIALNYTIAHHISPSDVFVDVGDDTSYEISRTGTFTGTTALNNASGFLSAIQLVVDASTAPSKVVVRVGSTTGALVTLTNLSVSYRTNSGVELVAGGIPAVYVMEDTPIGWSGVIADLGIYFTDGDGDALTFSVVQWEEITAVNASVGADGKSLDIWVASDLFGTWSVTVRASDPGLDMDPLTDQDNLFADANITINVLPTNDPPVIHDISTVPALRPLTNLSGVLDATQGQQLELDVNYTDIDHDVGSVSLEWVPEGMEINGRTITWTPDNDQVGFHEFRVNVTDGNMSTQELFSTVDIIVQVLDSPDHPVLGTFEVPSAYEDRSYNLTFGATDIDLVHGDSLTFSTNRTDGAGDDDLPGWTLVQHATSATISFIPGQEDVGSIRVNVSVTDSTSLRDHRDIVIVVKNTNDAPWGRIISPSEGESFVEGDVVEFNISVHDDDAVFGDVVTVSWVSNISGPVGGEAYINTSELDVGLHKITVTLSDGEALAMYSLNITIEPRPTGNGNVSNGTDGGNSGGGSNGTGNNGTVGDGSSGNENGTGGNSDSSLPIQGLMIGGIVLILVAGAVVLVVVLVLRKRKVKEQTADEANAPEPLTDASAMNEQAQVGGEPFRAQAGGESFQAQVGGESFRAQAGGEPFQAQQADPGALQAMAMDPALPPSEQQLLPEYSTLGSMEDPGQALPMPEPTTPEIRDPMQAMPEPTTPEVRDPMQAMPEQPLT